MPIPLLAIGHLWAAPLTVLGYTAAVLGGARFIGLERLGTAIFADAGRGLVGAAFRRVPMLGYTCGAVVVLHSDRASARTMAHELRHVAQFLALGLLMPLAYAVASLVAAARGGNAYVDNAFEASARAAGAAAE